VLMLSPSHVLGMSPRGGPSSVRFIESQGSGPGLLNARDPGRFETISKSPKKDRMASDERRRAMADALAR
jgi:hypothetical protein